MKRLIRSIVIFTFVMVATIAFNRVEVRATGYDPETGTVWINSDQTEDEWRAAEEAERGRSGDRGSRPGGSA